MLDGLASVILQLPSDWTMVSVEHPFRSDSRISRSGRFCVWARNVYQSFRINETPSVSMFSLVSWVIEGTLDLTVIPSKEARQQMNDWTVATLAIVLAKCT